VKEIRKLASARDLPKDEVSTVGQVMAVRRHGKTTFIDVHDEDARLQCQIRLDVVGSERYDFFRRYVERGDFLGASGGLFHTRMGELTLQVGSYTILAKALYDLPRAWFGLKDVETRYRQRYLDLLLNPEVRELFTTRSKIVNGIREFLTRRGFLEVETPLIQEHYGGAAARPFTTHVNDLDETRFLQISPELHLKRLIVGGFNRVFTVSKNFRNEEIDATHNPEFTMMEAYQAYADYNDVMGLTEGLFTALASEVWGSLKGEYDGVEVDLTPPWRRLTMYDALREYAGLDVVGMSDEDIRGALRESDPENYERLSARGCGRGLFIAQLFDLLCQDELAQPTFVIDYPRETVPLCKIHRGDPDLIERFELFVAGMEMANAYTELNDPILQERLFLDEERAGKGDEKAHPIDADFVEAMRYGMPPTGGLGVGIDRLVMLLTGQTSIKEVILFPMMRRLDQR
jgi:lysyl-tRNA synthetase class 2